MPVRHRRAAGGRRGHGLVVKVLKPIWTTKTETATRLRGRIESILDWATTTQISS
jgi:hypothetical protein